MNHTTKKTKALFLAAGIPTLIGTGFLEFLRFGDVFATVLVSLVAVLLVGFSLFFIAIGFTRFDRKALGITILHFLLLPVAGIILTGAYYFAAQYAPIGQWVEVITPPEQIEQFLPSSDPTIFGYSLFVKGKSGTIYSYDCVTYEECTWIQSEYEINEQNSYKDSDSVLKNRLMPVPPGRFVESQQNFSRGPDYETGVTFIRLVDGRIFYWTQFWSVYDVLFFLFGFSITGLITGIILSVTVFILRSKSG